MYVFQEAVSFQVIIFSVLIYVLASVYDIKTMEIPDKFSIMLISAGCVCILVDTICKLNGYIIPENDPYMYVILISPIQRVAGFFVIPGSMCLINLVRSESFGGGDIKLIASGGIIYGLNFILSAVLYALLSAGIFGILMIVTKRKKQSDHFPFAPFLCFGIILNLIA